MGKLVHASNANEEAGNNPAREAVLINKPETNEALVNGPLPILHHVFVGHDGNHPQQLDNRPVPRCHFL